MRKPVLALPVLLAGLLLVLWQLQPAPESPYAPVAAVLDRPLPAAATTLPEPQLDDALPPWAAHPADAGAEAAMAASMADALPGGLAAIAPGPAAERMQDIQQRLFASAASGAADPDEVAGLLAELESAQGSPMLGQVDLRVLRQNLLIAAQMQRIAGTIERAAAAQAPDAESIQSQLDELKALQARLRAAGGQNP